ncbi:hypothetical protein F4826_002977 [Rahnella inusitata]|nr:hypothetical protein [Rahnella inusitata]
MEQLLWIIERIIDWRGVKLESRVRAIDGLTPAVAQTLFYTTELAGGQPRDREKENELHGLWYAASSAVSGLDKKLASQCLSKSKYWLFPDGYNDTNEYKIDELNIRLIRMQAVLEELKHQ